MSNPKLLTTGQVAEQLGITRQTVLYHIKSGRLPATQVGRDYIISGSDLYLIQGLRAGPPKGAKPGAKAAKKKAPKKTRTAHKEQ